MLHVRAVRATQHTNHVGQGLMFEASSYSTRDLDRFYNLQCIAYFQQYAITLHISCAIRNLYSLAGTLPSIDHSTNEELSLSKVRQPVEKTIRLLQQTKYTKLKTRVTASLLQGFRQANSY